MRGRLHARGHTDEHILHHAALTGDAVEQGDLVEAVAHQQANARLERLVDLLGVFRVAVHHDLLRWEPGVQRHEQLAAGCHVNAQVFLMHHAQHRLGPEGLAGVDHFGTGIVRAEGAHIPLHGVAKCAGVVDDHRGAVLLGKLDDVASADREVAIRGHLGGRRKDVGKWLHKPQDAST